MNRILILLLTIAISKSGTAQISSNAIHFDGYDDVVTAFATYTLGYSDITFESWIRSERAHDPYTAELIFGIADSANTGLKIYLINGQIGSIFQGVINTQYQNPLGPDLRDSICHHIAVVRKSDSVNVYVDGIKVGYEVSAVGFVDYNMTVSIGQYFTIPGLYAFQGMIKEVRIWNVARTQSQIAANMNIVLNPTLNPGLLSYWRCNEGFKQVAYNIATLNCDGYFGTSVAGESIDPVWVQLCPSCPSLNASITTSGATTFCAGSSVLLKAKNIATYKYQWLKNGVSISGATSKNYTAISGGSYKVMVTDSISGCKRTTGVSTVVKVNPLPNSSITAQGPTTFCAGDSVVLKGNFSAGASYQWKKGTNLITNATKRNYTAKTAGNYRVIVTDTNGCSNTSLMISVNVPCKLNSNSISNKSVNDVSISPNPSEGIFLVRSDVLIIKQIEVINLIGEIVFSQYPTSDVATIDITNQPKGIYFVRVNTENGLMNFKVAVH